MHQCQRKASEWACVSVGGHAVTFFLTLNLEMYSLFMLRPLQTLLILSQDFISYGDKLLQVFSVSFCVSLEMTLNRDILKFLALCGLEFCRVLSFVSNSDMDGKLTREQEQEH